MPKIQLVMLTLNMLSESYRRKILIFWIVQFFKETTRGGGKSPLPLFLEIISTVVCIQDFFPHISKRRKENWRGGVLFSKYLINLLPNFVVIYVVFKKLNDIGD